MRTIETAVIRDAIIKAISVAGLTGAHAFLTFAGILPLVLPDGTRVVVLPDIHSPAHHKRLIWAIMQFLAWYKPHVLVFIGDLADIFAMSRHPKPLRAIIRPQEELDVTRRLIDELVDASGAAHVFVVLGNHEDRIYRFLQDLAPQLGGIVDPHTREPISFHSLMGYKRHDNITFIYSSGERGGFEGGLLINGDLTMHHGTKVRPKPSASPLADMDGWLRSVAHGHTHRFGHVAREVTASEEYPSGMLRGYELGMLADMDHQFMEYAHKMWPNWHYGFAVGNVHNGIMHMQPVPIMPVGQHNGQEKLGFIYDRKVFTESDR